MLPHWLIALSGSFLAMAPLADSSIVRLPCKMQANFDIVIANVSLAGSAIGTFTNTDRRQCCLQCLSHAQCKSLNHYNDTGVCEMFSAGFLAVVSKLTSRVGWTFISTTNEENACFAKANPCMNGGVCRESCNAAGYECSCPNDYYGDHCEDDPMSLLYKSCQSYVLNTLPRYDGTAANIDAHSWRCYDPSALTADGLLFSGSVPNYYSVHSRLATIITNHVKVDEFKVGPLNSSCAEACSALGKSCNTSLITLDSVYMFKLAGIGCKLPRTTSTTLSPYYHNKEDPVYLPSTGVCYGFARVPTKIDCTARHADGQRLCRCT